MANTADTGQGGAIARLLEQANRQRLSDQFDAARLSCHDVFALDPANAAAMCLLGVCDLESGAVEAGRAWLDKAEAANPALPQLHLYRSIQWELLGDPDRALAAATEATRLAPDMFDAWGRLGDLAGRTGDFAVAARALQRALETGAEHPARPQIALRLAGACIELSDIAATRHALDVAEQTGLAGHPEVLRLRTALARQSGDWAAMERLAQSWVEAAPGEHEALSAQALALGQLGFYARAARIYQPVAEADPEVADNWAALGRLVLGARDIPAARALFEKALALEPGNAEAAFGLARVHTFLGAFAEAEALCRRALESDPGHLEAYGQLCEVASGRLTDAELEALQAGVEEPGLAADRQAIGLFALGDALHRRQQPQSAFQAWTRANATKKIQHGHAASGGYDRSAQAARTDALMAMFPAEAECAALPAITQARPIFIVGMPRSGTTLIEAAIAAHDDVTAGGELSAMPFILEEFLGWARSTGWSGGEIPVMQRMAWRTRYFSQHAELGLDQAQWVTDKQPSNFLAVGLIRQLFPEAPVIHIRRRPVETAFSIYRRNFSRQWPFAHDLDDIAHYYAEHARLCAHWAANLPRRYTTLQYEALVADFEARLRYVIARTGLGWSRKCLDFHLQERSVMTFSSVQVRKPASTDHLNSTDAYAGFLDGFDDRIASLGVDPVTGEWTGEGPQDGAGAGTQAGARDSKRGLGAILGGLFGGTARGE
ncbi:sulfotransferase [Maricaulis sp.]|uniref:sulfotransferase n=1 Tax=Maricaulis sp. TaxID=1486257 RepID=UPI003A8EC2EF